MLELKGRGDVYFAGFVHVYDAALHGPAHIPAPALLDSSAPAGLEILYRVGLHRDKFVLAAERILARQHQDISSLRPRLDALHAAYRHVREGDGYHLCYAPDIGTELLLNDDVLIRIVGEDFARACLGSGSVSERSRGGCALASYAKDEDVPRRLTWVISVVLAQSRHGKTITGLSTVFGADDPAFQRVERGR
ncbi:chalcone isomerase-like protein [Desulfosoma caldarium]|uniref:Chalcone isomerase-like protein n=1 Tax=Desulfosoma caldarium TaxID=610254 RepID=A0A3N1UI10_9BACT|nr:chalcone isomerase-like protein [Desulfosoma caldarium]